MRKKESGFIQNFILPGLILIGVVVAGIAMLSSGASSDSSTDRTRMAVDVLMSQGVKLQSALMRAIAGGVIPGSLSGDVDLAATLMTSPIMPASDFPVPPEVAVATGQDWHYAQRLYRVRNAAAAPADIGSSQAEDVMYVVGVRKEACAFINARLYGSSSLVAGNYAPGGGMVTGSTITGPSAMASGAAADAAREGCVAEDGSTTSYVYYKVIGEH